MSEPVGGKGTAETLREDENADWEESASSLTPGSGSRYMSIPIVFAIPAGARSGVW